MASEKVTEMVLNAVDLKSSSCYKKVKRVLYKYDGKYLSGQSEAGESVINLVLQFIYVYNIIFCDNIEIREQVFDVDNNKVFIKVVSCNPEKIRDKLCSKGGSALQSIDIIENKPPADHNPKKTHKLKDYSRKQKEHHEIPEPADMPTDEYSEEVDKPSTPKEIPINKEHVVGMVYDPIHYDGQRYAHHYGGGASFQDGQHCDHHYAGAPPPPQPPISYNGGFGQYWNDQYSANTSHYASNNNRGVDEHGCPTM
ncbi:hypothetical protein QVD17_33576 [Tagetes erecta]|uniref:Uncharacterized protein n=1 Tax=Tagetes erecta TaxID=13708 RepID=A0AAD8JYY6_TARER|nr:hypothetical protein QVD17_33576 [Tagetes erecta]